MNSWMKEGGKGVRVAHVVRLFSLNRQAKWIHLSADGTNAIRERTYFVLSQKKENFDARENQREDG